MLTISTAHRRQRMMSQHFLNNDRWVAATTDADTGRPPASQYVQRRISETVDGLVALHSSDPVTVYLSLLTRIPEATVETIARSVYETRDLVRVHGMRRTLWMGSRETAATIVAASANRLLPAERRRMVRLFEDGGAITEAENWIDAAAAELEAHIEANGPCTTRQIGEQLPHLAVAVQAAPGKKYSATISAHSRVLLMLGFEGRIIRAEPTGTWIASQYRWVTPRKWLDDGSMAVDVSNDDHAARESDARQAIIKNYIDCFGPVTEIDMAWWTGWPKGEVRKTLPRLDVTEIGLADSSETGWVSASAIGQLSNEPPLNLDGSVALLPGLDPTTMGWKQRGWYLNDNVAAHLFDRNGNGGPAVMVDGQLVGGWAQRGDGELVYRLLADVGTEVAELVEARLEHLSRRLGDTRFKVRFPNPLNAELRR